MKAIKAKHPKDEFKPDLLETPQHEITLINLNKKVQNQAFIVNLNLTHK